MTQPNLTSMQYALMKQIVRNGDVPDMPHVKQALLDLRDAGCILIMEEATPRIRPTELGKIVGGRQHG